MSAAACRGGMTESDDDNGGGVSEIPHSLPPSSDEDDEEEAKRTSFLDCLASLEAFLPMKRGFSSHYYGRSKSFGNLTDLSIEDSKDLGKKEHAVNKRRRLLIAHEFREEPPRGGRSSNVTHASSMPVFLSDHCKDEDEEKEGVYDDNKVGNGDKNQEEDRK